MMADCRFDSDIPQGYRIYSMQTTIKHLLPSIYLILIVFLAAVIVEFSFFGEDGIFLWTPLLSEYVRHHYQNSLVIFGGQNLLAIYGELPIWAIFRAIDYSPELILNMTFVSLYVFFLIPTLVIYKGLTGTLNCVEQIIIGLYTLLSPIIINRVYVGHFNLLFGMLPLLISISLLYEKRIIFKVFSVLVLWCAFSIQGYQILSYYPFYIPILIFWVLSIPDLDRNKYFGHLIFITLIALILSFPTMKALISQASSSENLRSDVGNVVYTYLVSSWGDLGSLFFSSINELTSPRGFGFFHEINYPIGFSFIMFFFCPREHRKIFIALVGTYLLALTFAANVPVVNLISKLPLINLFRTPQRMMMLPAYLLSLLALSCFKKHMNLRSLLVLIALVLVGNSIPYFEMIVLPFFLLLMFLPALEKFRDLAPGIFVAVLMLGLVQKFEIVYRGNINHKAMLSFMSDLDQKLQLRSDTKIVHFESSKRFDLTVAANTLGIRTIEGYGHPPKSLIHKIQTVDSNFKMNSMNNVLFLNANMPNFKAISEKVGITDQVFVGIDGAVTYLKTSDLDLPKP